MTYLKTPIQLTEIIFPEHCNHYGTLFGGYALLLMSKAAFLAGRDFANANVVIVKSTEVEFFTPVPQGYVLTLHAGVTRVGRTSMTVYVTATAKNLDTESVKVLEGSFEMVAVDQQGQPKPIHS